MTKRQIQRIQCRLRRSVERLYYSYLTHVLRGLNVLGGANEVDHALASMPAIPTRCRDLAVERAKRSASVQRAKLRGDLGCARVRERLWQLQHLQIGDQPGLVRG